VVLGYAGLCVGLHAAARVVERKYAHLFKTEEHGVANRIVSSVHAALLGGIALKQMLSELDVSKNGLFLIPIHYAPFTAVESFGCRIMLGYLIYDSLLITAVMKQPSFPFAMVGHHVLGALSWSILLHTSEGGNYISWVHLAELSTPFLNIGWAMHMLGIKGLPATLAGVTTVLLFFLLRIVSIAFCLYSLWSHRGMFLNAIFPLQFAICTFFWLLNCMWFRQLLQVALKAAKKSKEPKPARTQD